MCYTYVCLFRTGGTGPDITVVEYAASSKIEDIIAIVTTVTELSRYARRETKRVAEGKRNERNEIVLT